MVIYNFNAPTRERKIKSFPKTTGQTEILNKWLVYLHTNKEVNVSNVISSPSFVEKEIQINGKNAKCLFDTGSELNLANCDTFQRLGSPELFSNEI